MSDNQDPDKNVERKPGLDPAKANRALGIFLLGFGLLVLLAVFFTETTEGRLANLAAGALLALIGGAMILKARTS